MAVGTHDETTSRRSLQALVDVKQELTLEPLPSIGFLRMEQHSKPKLKVTFECPPQLARHRIAQRRKPSSHRHCCNGRTKNLDPAKIKSLSTSLPTLEMGIVWRTWANDRTCAHPSRSRGGRVPEPAPLVNEFEINYKLI